MQHKVFLGINPPEYLEMKKDVDLTTSFSNNDILSGEPIPGRLLLSRACFRFGSTTQNSNQKTIFTTCLNSRPLSPGPLAAILTWTTWTLENIIYKIENGEIIKGTVFNILLNHGDFTLVDLRVYSNGDL